MLDQCLCASIYGVKISYPFNQGFFLGLERSNNGYYQILKDLPTMISLE